MWKRKGEAEWLPWYRARNYEGDLTEAEKRQLDAFRMQPKHPAAKEDALPKEVREYIGRIELELYDKKQHGAAGQALFVMAAGAAALIGNYLFGAPLWSYAIWSYLIAVVTIVLAWVWYTREWHKNAKERHPKGAPCSVTDEEIRKEWELNYIGNSREAERVRRRASSADSDVEVWTHVPNTRI